MARGDDKRAIEESKKQAREEIVREARRWGVKIDEAQRDLKLSKDASGYDEAMRRYKVASNNYQHWIKRRP